MWARSSAAHVRTPRRLQAGEKITPYAESLFKYALTKVDVPNAGNTDLYKVGDAAANNGTPPTTPVPGVTPGATNQPNLSVPPAGLFDKGQAGANRGQFNLPRGITRDAAGNFYVVDTQNERIQKFDSSGKWLSIIGSQGNSDGQFNPYSDTATGTGPGGVAVDSAGNIYVADTWNHRIQKFDKDGNYVTAWGSFINLTDASAAADPDVQSKFYGPRGVAIGPDGNVYVTDTGNKRVSIFTPDGKFVREISSGVTPDRYAQQYPYNKDGEMNEPIGIAVDKQGNVYVADSANHRIQVFELHRQVRQAVGHTGRYVGPRPLHGALHSARRTGQPLRDRAHRQSRPEIRPHRQATGPGNRQRHHYSATAHRHLGRP